MTRKKDWKPVFLEAYRENGNVKEAAEAAGVTKQAVYKARKAGAAFAEQFDRARDELADDLEAVAIRRARDKSDTMLIFLLKGLKPNVYGDKVKQEHIGAGGGPIRYIEVAGD